MTWRAFPRLELWRYPDGAAAGWNHPLERHLLPELRSDPLVAQHAHFCRVVSGEEEPIITGEDELRTLAATLAVLESADLGRPIDLPGRPPSGRR